MQRKLLNLAALAAALSIAHGAAQAQTAPTTEELAKRVEQLAAELAALKAQLAQAQAAQPAQAAAPASTAPTATAEATPHEPATVITSYGEINYNRPTGHSEQAQADLRRFVLGLQHRFDERTKLVTELEVEHAVASKDDNGEVEVEQAYIERQLNPQWAARAGLFLIPIGLLNENHEPTAYYGVERNFVETAIIPTTWREGGVQFVGNLDNGLTLQAGLSTGFNLGNWGFGEDGEGRESPLGSVHQELQLAKAHDVALFGAANWRGIPGLQLGASLFTGNAGQGQAGLPQSRITLWDLHARWTPGRWDLAALYSRGSISNTEAWNLPNVGSPNLMPSSFDGWYAQAAYKLWSSNDQSLSPFVRWEQFNTAKSFADLGAGLTPEAQRAERVITAGLNYYLTPEIVLKADLQRFREDSDANRFDLGLGWSF
jgi:hypothetical protein